MKITKILFLAFFFFAFDLVHAQPSIGVYMNDGNNVKNDSSLHLPPKGRSASDAEPPIIEVPMSERGVKTFDRESRDDNSRRPLQTFPSNFIEKDEQPTNQSHANPDGPDENDVQPVTIEIPEGVNVDGAPEAKDERGPEDALPDSLMIWLISIALGGTLFLYFFATKLLKSTGDLIQNLQSTTHAQSRAYLSLNVIAVHPSSEGDLPAIVLEIRNEGQTPAHSIDVVAGVHVLGHPIQNNAIRPEMYFFGKINTLFSSAPSTIKVYGQHPLSSDQMASIYLGSEQRLYVHAFISYKDIYKQTHFSMLCLSIFNLRLVGNKWAASFEHAPIHNNIGTLIL